MTVRIFTDGACSPNPGMMGIGVVVEWKTQEPMIISKYAGEGTNNIAEYEALLYALWIIYSHQIKDVEINSDSDLMVNQVNGNWRCKDKKLKKLCDEAQEKIDYLINRLDFKINLIYTPREFNLADTPAKNGIKKGM